ncbi:MULTISPECIES: RrF2 family transcriptional regulator [Catellatospora]|uniref:Rrf2 family transcriptional regulator n=1 Tax=Catellatospora citrea TaxID=53366 RepID=A0A8J3NWL5_9ACTN|nr:MULTISPECIES: Rrf2 family transcriptional regulator [Catellatospora]RKE07020.1 BadM/Rrf2 family transcriptional regulator [Catellatospora citrea]GIF95172.1 Rrf2 family transcriptional regulator [Catellatospora citrea]
MRLSARVDYALRAVIELASGGDGPVTSERIARAQEIPPKFCESILLQLRRGGIVFAQRGPEGGYWLARPAEQISLVEVVEVIDGPLGSPRAAQADVPLGAAQALQQVWTAVEESERAILTQVTIAHVIAGVLPEPVAGRLPLAAS